MCGPKGYGFPAVLVIHVNRVSTFAILDINMVCFFHSSLELGMFLEEATFSSLSIRPSTKALNYLGQLIQPQRS